MVVGGDIFSLIIFGKTTTDEDFGWGNLKFSLVRTLKLVEYSFLDEFIVTLDAGKVAFTSLTLLRISILKK